MKKSFFKSIALVCCILIQHSGVFAQGIPCPSVTPTGIPTAAGSSAVALPCGVTCATLTASATTTLTATTSYSVAAVAYAPFSYTTGTTPPTLWLGAALLTARDDAFSSLVPLPFSFCFFGNTYNAIAIGTNGNISFNTTGATSVVDSYDPWGISGPIPGASTGGLNAVRNCIMGPWHDLYPITAGTIKYTTYGTAPCRQFVVSWNGVQQFISAPAGTECTHQIVLYESSNIIDVNIQSSIAYTGWNNGYAVTGIANNVAAAPVTLFYTAPGENGVAFTATNQAWRFTPTGAASGWTYAWTGPTGAAGTGATVVVCPTVNTTYTVTATSTACTAVTVNATIPVTVAYVTPVTGITSFCIGSSTTLANATAGGTWSSSNTAVATIGATGVVSSVSPGTAVISYTLPASGGGTPCSATTIVTVQPIPVISGTTSVCAGGSTTLSASAPGGTWVSGNPGIATITSPGGVLTGVLAGTTTITYTSPAGCIGYATVTVFNPAPIGGPYRVCMASTTTLTNTTSGGTWTSSNTSIATIDISSGVATGVLGGTTNITYTTPGGCIVDTILTVDSTAPISGLTEVCQFFTIPLTNTLGGGTWTSGNTAVATVGLTTGIVTGVTGGTATITYTITATGCKMVTVVTVHPKPVPPTITSQTVFCQFEIPTPLAASGSGLQWYGLGVTPPMTIAPTPVTDIARVDTYYVTQTVIGCVSDSTTVLVTIKPKPAPPITRDTMYCQYFDQAPALTAIGSGLKWYTASGTLLTSAPVPPTNFVGSTTWYVNQTVNGCTSDKTPLTVTIIIKPDFAIKASALKVCQFDTLVFSYDGPAMVGAGFLWDLPIGTAVTRGSIYDSVITVRFDTAWGTHSIFLTASNLNGMCFTTKQIDIKVIPQPFAHGYINPDICFGDTILLALSDRSANASTFTWLVDGTPLTSAGSVNIITANSSSGGPFLISFNDTGRHIIKLQASVDGLCPSKIEPDSINVHGLPDASFRILEAAKKLCLEDSVEFQATKIAYNYSYAWAPTHSFSNENKPRIWGRMESERSIVTLTVTDPFGCKASTDMELNPETCCSVFMPSAFSPNGDGLNDKYFPKFNGYHRLHIFRITNRWGQTVFENTNSDAQWDGTYNGVPQDMGVYFYYIKYDCGGKTLETKGDCTLVR